MQEARSFAKSRFGVSLMIMIFETACASKVSWETALGRSVPERSNPVSFPKAISCDVSLAALYAILAGLFTPK